MALPCSAPRGEFVRGWQPLRLLIWALRPTPREFVRGWQPLRLLIWALRPKPREFVRGWQPLRPLIWALRPKPRVTFPSRGKSPKARQGLRPLESPKGDAIAPPAASRNPLDGGSATAKDRFATLSLWANRSLLFHLALTKRNLLLSIRGAGASRGRCGCTFVCNF